MVCLSLQLLGDPHLLDGEGRDLAVASRKALALLAYLALHPGTPQPRETLIGLLWGDRQDPQARQSLRQTLYGLRKLIGAAGEDVLEASGDTVALDASRIAADVWSFERLAASPRQADLEAAVKLYRGPLLNGLAIRDPHFSDWLRGERDRLQEKLWSVHHELARIYKAKGEIAPAIAAARALLALNPLSEKAHRLLMRLLLRSDARAEALLQYQRCLELLRGELGVEPDLATIRLYEEIKASAAPGAEVETEAEAGAARRRGFFAAERPAVAVLGFRNIGGDAAQDYFAEGMTTDIAALLAGWRWFPVIGANSSLQMTATGADPSAIAQELEARYVVTGSVRKTGDRVRITVELTDAETRHNLWAGRYDAVLEEIPTVQDEITARIATGIEPHLERAEQERSLRKPLGDLSAWERVMRANWLKNELTQEHNRKAIALLEEAVAIDPVLGAAWSSLSHCHLLGGILGWNDGFDPGFAESERCARKALALDAGDWLAHTMLGLGDLWHRRDFEAALERHARAVELNPSASIAHHAAADSLMFAGRPDEATAHLRAVLRLDPQYAFNAMLLADLGLCSLLLGQHEDAATYARKSASLRPDYPRAYHRLAASLGQLGDAEGAREALAGLRRLQPGFDANHVRATYPFREPAHLELLLDGLRKAGLA